MKKTCIAAIITLIMAAPAFASPLGQEFVRVENAFADWGGVSPLVFTPATDVGQMYRIMPDRIAWIIQMEYQKLGYGRIDANKILAQLNRFRGCHQEDSKINSVSDALETLGQPRNMCNPMTTGLVAQAALAARK